MIGEELEIRASVRLRDIGASALGPLGAMLGDRERMQLGGTFHVIRPGVAEFEIKDIKLHDLTLPPTVIPKLLRSMGKATRPAGGAVR